MINSFQAFQIDHIMRAPMLMAYVSGNKAHQSPIRSYCCGLTLNPKPKDKPNQTDCEKSQLKNIWSFVSISFKQKGHDESTVLINLERFIFTTTALCKYLQMNIITCGGMLLNFHSALNILLKMESNLVDDEAFLLVNWVYADLVEKLFEGVRVRLDYHYHACPLHLGVFSL